MLNTGIKQEFNEYKKKSAASNLQMQGKFEALTLKFESLAMKFESLTVKFRNSLKTIATQNDRIEILETNLTSTPDISGTKLHFHYEAVFSGMYQSSTGIIKFNSEISSSSDNSYNPKTGLFTAPYDGVFVFIVQYHATNSRTEVGIYIDNIDEVRSYMSTSLTHGTTSLVTQLTKGQVVEARLMQGQVSATSKHHTSFQGFQI